MNKELLSALDLIGRMKEQITEQLDLVSLLRDEIAKRDKQIESLKDELVMLKGYATFQEVDCAFPTPANFSDLQGEVLSSIIGMNIGSKEVHFSCKSGKLFRMYHQQDCCESVELADVVGEVSDLVNGKPVNLAEQVSNDNPSFENVDAESYTWTFYNIQAGGCIVTLRWLGTSNGYYSESVNFQRIK